VFTVNFDRDATDFFGDAAPRALVHQAANDCTAFFTGMNLDQVPVGAERTHIWHKDFQGGYYSVAHHEIGHALIFNPAHAGFATAKTAGGFSSAAVTNYYGGGGAD
jgi:hypothetical protein